MPRRILVRWFSNRQNLESRVNIRCLTFRKHYSLYLALFAKKRLSHPARIEESGSVSSPRNKIAQSPSGKILSKSPEI
jgi:hypothetical protein